MRCVDLALLIALAPTLAACSQQPPAASAVPAGAAAPAVETGGARDEEPEVSPLVGKPAPDVELELLDGGHFSLKEQKDKQVVILDFWATWCGPCVREMPLVAQVAEEYRDQDVALYCLNLREDADTIREFLDQKALKVAVSLDSNGEAGRAYGVEGIPTLVLIDKAGLVRSVHVGFSPDIGEKLKHDLDAVLADKNLAAEAEEK